MVLVGDNWEQVYDLQDVSKIIRENYNKELADVMDKLIPEHTDEDYENLEYELSEKESEIFDLDDENEKLKSEIERLEKILNKIQDKLNECLNYC